MVILNLTKMTVKTMDRQTLLVLGSSYYILRENYFILVNFVHI